MSLLLAVVVFASLLWLALFLAYCHLCAAPTRKSRTRYRRRGGYIKPPASLTTSHAAIRKQLAQGTTASFSSHWALGTQSGAGGIQGARALRNRLIVPTAYGSETEAPGASGARLDSAASELRSAWDALEKQDQDALPETRKLLDMLGGDSAA